MNLLKNIPIGRKLNRIILVTCGMALLLAVSALFIFQTLSVRRDFQRDLTVTGNIIANNSTAALEFKDQVSAAEILDGLKAEPAIISARIYTADGSLLASYGPEQPEYPVLPEGVEQQTLDVDDHLILTKSIQFEGKTIGALRIWSNYTTELRRLLWLQSAIAGIALAAALLAAFFLANRLQKVISNPLLTLADTASRVAKNKDYSVRAEVLEQDEVGRLTGAFNEMLTQIQKHDDALRESRQRFEVAVMGSSDGIWDWDLRANHIYFSPRWKGMIGYTEEELPDAYEEWEQRLHPEDRDRVLNELRAYLDGRIPHYQVEFRMAHKNGQYRWILARGAALRDESGQFFRMAGSHTDITAQKQAQAELESNRRVMENSRQAGMAEVATGVLHNVGNVLNSVNVSTTLLSDQLRQSKISNLARAVALLRENAGTLPQFLTQDPKGRMLPDYLVNLAGHLETERAAQSQEVEQLAKNITHIKDIVAMQQNYARVSGVVENIALTNLVEDAIQINAAGFSRHRIEIVRDFEEVPSINVDRHKVLQILVNLAGNAKYALDAANRDDKRLVFQIRRQGDDRVQVSIQDNGVGIPPENLTRIFQHGFTTRKNGHGFGLHSGANAAREIGGSLSVHSKGLGSGATFTLELPVTQPEYRI
jgi:PAS domain S-box-containing protein